MLDMTTLKEDARKAVSQSCEELFSARPALMNPDLHTELWTSWASLLRSYAAAHGLNATQHAVVEVSADEITLRVGTHWLHFTATAVQHDDAPPTPFALQENGTVT